MKQRILFLMFSWVLLLLSAATTGNSTQDHPVIKPIPGFVLDDSKSENFSSYTFRIKDKDQLSEKQVKGKYYFYYYEYQKDDKEYSKLEIIENYRQAAREKGGKILYGDDTKLDFSVPKSDGGTVWAHLHTWVNSYELYIIEQKGFDRQLFFGADEMKKQLDAVGHVAIYGIYFDFDRADLKPGSEKMLVEMVKLMKNHPDLKVEIQGHTDSTGTREYNLKLSEKRAETVKSFLVLYGVDSSRMIARGYGLSQPVASNETEEGRALNRRVELNKL